jgi:hypothetical protein
MIDELLREARPNPAPPDATVTLRARRAVLRQAVAGRVRRRYAARAGVLVTAAAAVLAVLGVMQSPEHGASPAAAAILDKSAARIEQTTATTPGEYVYRREISTTWGYSESPRIDDSIETWIPVEENQPLIQRTTDENGEITFAVVDQDHTEAHAIYRDHPTQPAAMLDALRDYARTVQGDASDSAVWGSAFSLLADSQTPDGIRADVVRALAGLDGVEVADQRVRIGSRFGVSLRYDEKYAPELIFDPSDGTFLGMRGFPEIDKSWVGPHKPMWTIRFVTKIVDTAPTPPASQLP